MEVWLRKVGVTCSTCRNELAHQTATTNQLSHKNLAFVSLAFICAPLLSEDYHEPKKLEERNGKIFQQMFQNIP